MTEIDPDLMTIYNKIDQMEKNPDQHIPGIYNFNFKHLPEKAQDICLLELGQPNYQNLYQYYDRKDILVGDELWKKVSNNTVGIKEVDKIFKEIGKEMKFN